MAGCTGRKWYVANRGYALAIGFEDFEELLEGAQLPDSGHPTGGSGNMGNLSVSEAPGGSSFAMRILHPAGHRAPVLVHRSEDFSAVERRGPRSRSPRGPP